MTAFSVHKAKVASEDLKVIKDLEASAQLEATRMISGQEAVSAKAIGLGMIAFFTSMLIGIFSGSHIRTHDLFVPKKEIFQPIWEQTTKKPSTFTEAVEWMKISNILLEGGLSEEHVVYVLDLPLVMSAGQNGVPAENQPLSPSMRASIEILENLRNQLEGDVVITREIIKRSESK